jgi:hypothetical protein
VPALKILPAGASRAQGAGGALTGRDGLAMSDFRERGHDDARARHLGTPAPVEIFTEKSDEWVESAQGGKEIGAYQRDTARSDKDVALKVLLAVINLSQIDSLANYPEAVAGLADMEQNERVLVGHKFWRDNAGVRAKGRFDHQL